jgi:hypothetical protein
LFLGYDRIDHKRESKVKFVKALSIVGVMALSGAFVGCLNDSGPSSSEGGEARLLIQAGVKDVNKAGNLRKSSVITLEKLIITMTSHIGTDSVIRDTILASDTSGSSFTSVSTSDQTFAKNYSVKPFRNYTIEVKTLDVNDSIIHYHSTTADSMKAGETRPITVSLTSRFVMYEAKFSLPDSLNFTAIDVKQKLNIDRVLMIVDGDTVADSSRVTPFSSAPTVHTVRFDYMNVTDTPDVKIEFYGRVGDDTTVYKMFEYLFENVSPTNESPTPVQGVYTGPPSSSIGAFTGLTINIGKVGTVVFQPILNPNVSAKQAVKD